MDKLKNKSKKAVARVQLALVALMACGCAGSEGLLAEGKLLQAKEILSGKTLSQGRQNEGTWPAAGWWRALGDGQLDALIEEAMQGNPDLELVDARRRQAGALAQGVDAARAPSISANGSAQNIRIPGSMLSALGPGGHDMSMTTWMASLNASYRVDLWGGEKAAWEAAMGQQRAVEIEARAARLKLSADVARAYVGLWQAWQARELAQKDVERTRRLAELAAQRERAGLDGAGPQRQAEAVAAAARQHLAQTAHAIESGQIALAVLIGKGPDRAAEIGRPGALQPLALAVPADLPADLAGRRADIVAARWRVEAAQRSIDAAKTSFYPSFNLSAALGLMSLQGDSLLSLANRYHTAAPAISLPIFDGGRLRADLAGRNADYDLAVARYNKTLIGAFNEIAQHIQAARALEAQAAAQRQSVGAARDGWELAQQRQRRGIGSQIDVLNAEQAVLAKEAVLADIQARQIDSAIQLVHALGGGYAAETAGSVPPLSPQNTTSKVSS